MLRIQLWKQKCIWFDFKIEFLDFLPSMGVMLSNSRFGRRQENDSVWEKGGKKTLISNLSCTFPLWLCFEAYISVIIALSSLIYLTVHTYDVRTAFTLQEFGRGVVQTDMHGKIYHCWAISYATFFLLSICPVRTKK